MLQAIDSETMLIMPGGIAPAPVCFTYAQNDRVGIEVAQSSYEIVKTGLEHHHTTWANAPFDLGVIGQRWPTLIPLIFKALDENRVSDVLSREKLLDIAKGCFRFKEDEDGEVVPIKYGLGDVAQRRRVGRKMFDEWRLHYYKLHGLPLQDWPDEAKRYACIDAIITLEVHKAQDKEIADDPTGRLLATIQSEFEAVRGHWALQLITAWGFCTDGAAVEDLYLRCREERERMWQVLYDAGLVRDDGSRDTKKAKAMVLQAYGEDDVPITATGQERMKGIGKDGEKVTPITPHTAIHERGYISTSKETCWQSGDETLSKYARYSQLANLLGKDIPHLRKGTVIPVQAGYQPIMETFRTSSVGFNIQNLRREPGVRECFRPREGYVLVPCDFDTAELVSLAQVTYTLFGASDMRDTINAGLDIHLKVAAYLLDITYDEAKRRKKEDDEAVDMTRQLSKALDFGLPGGMGAKRFSGYAAGYLKKYNKTVSERDAAVLKRRWMGWFREMPSYFDWIKAHADEDGYFWVQHPITKRWRGKMFYTAACNNGFQELTAFGAKAAAYAVAREQHCNPHSPLYGTKTLAFIHDELILEMPEDRYLTQRANELQRVMCEAYNVYTPDVPVSAEAKATRVWSKAAKRITDERTGELLVWEPERKAA